MNGRQLFNKYEILIKISVRFFKLLPKKFRTFLWYRVQSWHGKIGIGLRYSILSSMIAECGKNVSVETYVDIRNWEKLHVGDNVSINAMSYIDAAGGIYIGNNVSIAHNTSLVSFNHTWDDNTIPIKYNPSKFGPIIIDDDVWVGCGCRILANVRIESRSIIAAGAVVVKDVEYGSVVGGTPAKLIKKIT